MLLFLSGFLFAKLTFATTFSSTVQNLYGSDVCFSGPSGGYVTGLFPGSTDQLREITIPINVSDFNVNPNDDIYIGYLDGAAQEVHSDTVKKSAIGASSTYTFTFPHNAIDALTGLPITKTNDNIQWVCAFTSAHNRPTFNNTDGFDVSNTTGGQISFQQPNFQEGRVTNDFSQWWLCTVIPANHVQTGYYFTVDYGTSTPYGIGHDSLKDKFGILPLTTGTGVNECPLMTKSATTSPGTYKAIATLYDQNDATITQSSILNITISSGDITQVPDSPDVTIPTCGNTSFALLGVDFGKGLCDVGRYLFVPSDSVISDGQSLYTTVQEKIPFSYFAEIQGIIANVGSGTPASFSPVKIQTSSTSSVPNLNVEIFSTTTIASATSRSGFSTLRTVANVLLYIGFAFALYETAIHKAKEKGK